LNGFGVGTSISTSRDAPALGGIYKLVEVERHGELVATMKLSAGKHSLPGRKQVWRTFARRKAAGDTLGLADEAGPEESVPLLKMVMKEGRRLAPCRPLSELRASCRELVSQLPADLRGLAEVSTYPVVVSGALERLERAVNERLDRVRG
jgi:nicotinate phosphoribosyltransferase